MFWRSLARANAVTGVGAEVGEWNFGAAKEQMAELLGRCCRLIEGSEGGRAFAHVHVCVTDTGVSN